MLREPELRELEPLRELLLRLLLPPLDDLLRPPPPDALPPLLAIAFCLLLGIAANPRLAAMTHLLVIVGRARRRGRTRRDHPDRASLTHATGAAPR